MKIFGVGLDKTGTTTLRDCLRILDYDVKGFDRRLTYLALQDELAPLFDVCERHHAFQDLPWPLVYRQLDQRYPGSKFILTTRSSSNVWFESQKKHAYRRGPRRHRRLVYGNEMPHRHRQRHVEVYERHNADVRQYFEQRPDDLLDICWETGRGWEPLCAFLGHSVPAIPTPHANKSSDNRETIWQQVKINASSGLSLMLDR